MTYVSYDSHFRSLNLYLVDLKCFPFGYGAEFDLGANRRWVIIVVDFPEELRNAMGPFTHYDIVISISKDLPKGKRGGNRSGNRSRLRVGYSHT